MNRFHQFILITSTLGASWFGMQAVHECGHVLGAFATGAEVKRVVLNPLTISRTDLGANPFPLFVVWMGPIFGVLFPLIFWLLIARRTFVSHILRFFSGFCCIANGAYIAFGSFEGAGDCGEMLMHGTPIWMLWLFGAVTVPIGFWLWHGQGRHFGLGTANGSVDRRTTYFALAACSVLILSGILIGGK